MSYVPGKPKKFKDLQRRSRGVKEFTRVLIACEGEKTEPNYFQDLCRALGLTAAIVEVTGKECGSSPLSVCDYAMNRLKEDGGFDQVFCVFDRDTHPTFDAAVQKIAGHRSKKISSIVSYPCFEYWILLHFRYTRSPVRAVGGRSAGDQMLALVLQQWPEYAKGSNHVYRSLADRSLTDVAIANSATARADAAASGNPDPSTDVDRLVARLRELGLEAGSLAN